MNDNIKEQLIIAKQIQETLATEGWKHIEKLLKDYVAELDSLRGVETMKELLGRRHAVKLLESWLNMVRALAEFEPLRNASKKMSIYKIVNSSGPGRQQN